MSSRDELACIYAAMILHDDGAPITAEKILTLVKTADVDIEPFWADMFARVLQNRDVGDLITSIGAPCAAQQAANNSESKPVTAEEKKDEEKAVSEEEDSDEDMGFGLFD